MDKDTYGVELELIVNKFKNKMSEITDMVSELQDKYVIEIDPELNLDQLEQEFKKAFIELSKFKNIEVLSPEQLEQVSLLKMYMNEINNRMVQLGGKRLKFTSLTEAKDDTKKIADNMDIISGKSGNAGNNISRAMTRATKSLKRFALSLFGIQSLWTALSRAARTYMNQNKELQRKIQSVWSGLGTLIAPLVDFLANIFLKLLGYINVVTKALFGFDFIAKANANTLKNYQKQANKTAKALAGIDEITNINQETGSGDDNTGPNLIETPELDPKIVKFLQNVSEVLKDNWNWLKYVAEGLALCFGVSAVAGWISNIGKLLGVAGTGAGAKGLLGLGSVLGWIATIGIITITIRTIYETIHKEDMENLVETTSDLAENAVESSDGFQDVSNSLKKTTKNAKKGSTEINNYNNYLRDTIWSSADMVKINEKNVGALGLVEKAYLWVSGGLSDYNEQQENFKIIIEENNDKIKSAVQQWQELYKQGKLNKEQTQQYSTTMELLGYNIDGSKMSVGKYMTVLQKYGFSELEVMQIIRNENDAYGLLADKLKEVNTKTKVATDTTGVYADEINNVNKSTKNWQQTLDNLCRKKYGVDIQSKFGVDAEEIKKLLLSFKNSNLARVFMPGFDVNKMITNFLKDIGALSVGTDLIKSDGLAYLHAGEKVVPADYVKGGYSGGDNNETNSLLRELINVVDSKNFTAEISENEIGSASVNYIRNQSRIMGGSIL